MVLKHYDIIGFLEDFTSFIDTLRNQANFRYKYHDKRINVSRNRPPHENILQTTRRKIEEVNFLDIAFYRKNREAMDL